MYSFVVWEDLFSYLTCNVVTEAKLISKTTKILEILMLLFNFLQVSKCSKFETRDWSSCVLYRLVN